MIDIRNINSIFASAVLVMLCDTKIRHEEIDSLKSKGKINLLISSFDEANKRINESDIISIFEEKFETGGKHQNLMDKSMASKIIKKTTYDFSKIESQGDLHKLVNHYAMAVKENYWEFATLICLFMAVIDRELAREEVDLLYTFAKAWNTEELLDSSLHQMGLHDI